ncbi:hypothetical protein D5H75_06200 [Bailinhaonella thermotolerans]|uniref:Uncharacterized protein n=1 Tax=Bailinhaonella thermotolerans TaxID=1070861 RepID=A0A3A4AWH1_9ACTN|nr:hypothetical protein D5H75_06200 [Bailinhaonella thermotolerans]
MVAGEYYRDGDEHGLRIRDSFFECGCRVIRHEFHDGSCHERAVRHDGRVVKDQYGPDHGC